MGDVNTVRCRAKVLGEVSVKVVCLQDWLGTCRQVLTLARLAEICFGKRRMALYSATNQGLSHTLERLIRPLSAAISCP